MENEMKTEAQYQTRPVLGGAYRSKSPASLLTHLVDTTAGEQALCRRAVNIADYYSVSDEERAARPSCPVCAKKWDRLVGTK